MIRLPRRAALALAAGLAFPGPSVAQVECRLALVLALDVSSSVDPGEYELQKLGLAAALDSVVVREALMNKPLGYVALSVFEWSGRYQQEIVLDWTRVDNAAAIDHAVATVARAERSYSRFPTAVGYALGFAAGMLKRGPDCRRRVIDVSGDGVNNEGFAPALAYAEFPFKDVVVNGLVILGSDAEVLPFYRREVRRGPGAFVEVAQGFEDFANAMTDKLYREINDLIVGDAAEPEMEEAG